MIVLVGVLLVFFCICVGWLFGFVEICLCCFSLFVVIFWFWVGCGGGKGLGLFFAWVFGMFSFVV